MKTPDEIKKGLECCANDAILCSEKCPYYDTIYHRNVSTAYLSGINLSGADFARKTEVLNNEKI